MQQSTDNQSPSPAGAPAWVDRHLPDRAPVVYPYNTQIINMSAILGFAWRQRYLLGGVIGAVLLIGLIISLLMKPVYEAEATVRVDPEGGFIVEGQDLEPQIHTNEVYRYLNTLASVVESQNMAYLIVDSLNLDSREDFIGEDALADRPDGISDEQWRARKRNMAAAIVAGNVEAEVPQDRRIISIRYQSEDRVMAAAIANSYAENFLTDDVRRGLEANSYAQNYLEGQIEETRARLQDAERQAISYAKANRIVGQPLGGSSDGEDSSPATANTLTVANLASINSRYSDARAKRIEAQQRWNAVASQPASQLPEVQQNSTVQALQTERSNFAGQLSDISQRYGDNYPEVRELKAKIASLDRQIDSTSSSIKSSLRSNYEVALRQEQALYSELNRISDETLDEQDRRVQFNLLERDAESLRNQLANLLQRYNQISSAANIRPGNITLLDAAVAPNSPVSPNIAKNLLIAFILGTGLAIGLAILREAFDDRLRSADDVERKLGVPLLGQTPLVSDSDYSEDFRPLAEAYSSIRTSVDFVLPKRNHNVLLLTSSLSSEGKTTTSVVLAKKYAQLGHKVLLIDADLRKPSIAPHFGATVRKEGIVEVLLGKASLQSVLIDQPIENLDVVPVGKIPPNPVDVLSSALIKDFIDQYREEYSFIIIDSPPVMGIADAPLLARLADGVIFMVEANRAHFGQVKTAMRRLRDANAVVLGAVLTKFRALEAGQSYDYHYSYYMYEEDRS